MSGYEYGNARLRAMRSRLLSRRELLELTEAKSLPELIGLIARTPYRKSLEVALVQASDLESVYEALRRDFVETIGKVRSFYDSREGKLVDLILRGYDVHNLKSVLRGLSHQVAQAEIARALLPTADLPAPLLNELLKASSPRDAIDLLATIRHPFAQPLLTLRAERPGADVAEMEHVLERWRFEEAMRRLQNEDDNGKRLLTALSQEADILNMLLVMRFIQQPAEQQALKAHVGKAGLEGLFPALGTLSVERLSRVYAAKSIREAVELLADTRYAPALQAGLRDFGRSGLLSDVELALTRYQLRWNAAQIVKDPLGIGVVMGYVALKISEIRNLRRIARGIQLKMTPGSIQAEMELAE